MIEEDFYYIDYFSFGELKRHYLKKGFSIEDALDEIKKISYVYIMKMDGLRRLIDSPVYFNSLTDGKHVKNSYHYQGKAGDWYTKSKKHPNQILQYCIDVGFTRIGYYPEWNKPGFHTDTGTKSALWTKKGSAYLPLLEEND